MRGVAALAALRLLLLSAHALTSVRIAAAVDTLAGGETLKKVQYFGGAMPIEMIIDEPGDDVRLGCETYEAGVEVGLQLKWRIFMPRASSVDLYDYQVSVCVCVRAQVSIAQVARACVCVCVCVHTCCTHANTHGERHMHVLSLSLSDTYTCTHTTHTDTYTCTHTTHTDTHCQRSGDGGHGHDGLPF